MRGQGRVYLPKVGGRESLVWWLDYGLRGARHRESSHTTSKRAALELLRQRIGKRRDGTLSGQPDRVTLAQLKAGLRQHYTIAGRTSWPRAAQAFVHLEAFFGAACRVPDLTRERVVDYQASRLGGVKPAARNTVRLETAILAAAFGVAVRLGTLPGQPSFTLPSGGDKRSGFFEAADFAAVVVELPGDVADLVRFLCLTGWRKGEGTGLMWAQVDWDDAEYPGRHAEPVPGPKACIRIGEAQTKGGDAREFPIGSAPELRELLAARWRVRDGLRVFHRNGRPVGDFRKVWDPACEKAGVAGRLVHDLRRTAARDFRRAGVSEGEIMKLCGWKTRDMFDRYNIIDATDLARAVARRFNGEGNESHGGNGKVAANKAAPAG